MLGLLLTSAAAVAGEQVLGWLGLVSGILVLAVGITMIAARFRRGPHHDHGHGHQHFAHSHDLAADHGHDHTHAPATALGHGHPHAPATAHSHDHPHATATGHNHGHPHSPAAGQGHHDDDHGRRQDAAGSGHHAAVDGGRPHDAVDHEHHADAEHHGHSHGRHGTHAHPHRPSRLGIAGIGIAGGLVPSPSALIVLLGAIGLGRTAFGVLLVLFYGLGMAATLTAAGLLLLRIQRRLASQAGTSVWARLAGRLSTVAPATTAWLVLLLGIGLAGRAAAGLL